MEDATTFSGDMKGRHLLLILALICVLILPAFELVTRGQTNWMYVAVGTSMVVLVWFAKFGASEIAGWWLKWYLSEGRVVITRLKTVTPTMLGERKLTVVWRERLRDGSEREVEGMLTVFFLGMERYQAGQWLHLWLRPGRKRNWRPVDQLLIYAAMAGVPVPACLEAEGVPSVPFPEQV